MVARQLHRPQSYFKWNNDLTPDPRLHCLHKTPTGPITKLRGFSNISRAYSLFIAAVVIP